MRRLEVSLKNRAYPILVGQELISHAGTYFKKAGLSKRRILIVSQKQIAVYYEKALRDALTREGFDTQVFIAPAGKSSEASKTQAVWNKLVQALSALDGKNRPLALAALGGGVIGDLTGFAASVYRRGIPYVQIPTTLTAQVDSSIGGKTGVDLPQGKNLLGTIYQPALVLADTLTLQSLPDRHWSDGFAEVIKYGMIKDASFFCWLEKMGLEAIRKDAGSLEKVVSRCAQIKAQVVAEDEFDKEGVRIILNFGHTAGHAIENASSYSGQYTHGEAVAIGMLVACDIAKKMGILKERDLAERLEKILIKFSLPVFYKGLSQDTILRAMGYDKKSENQKNRWVLPIKLGKVTIERDIPESAIVEALEKRKR